MASANKVYHSARVSASLCLCLCLCLCAIACGEDPSSGSLSERAAFQEAVEIPDGVVALDPPAPPLSADGYWAGLDAAQVIDAAEAPTLVVSTEASSTVSVELRADVDGEIFSLVTDPVDVEPGAPLIIPISVDSLGITKELQFAAMVEAKLRVTQDGQTRIEALEPVYVHPAEAGFLLYGEDAHEQTFAGGDFRGLVKAPSGETEPASHISIARVRVLTMDESPKSE